MKQYLPLLASSLVAGAIVSTPVQADESRHNHNRLESRTAAALVCAGPYGHGLRGWPGRAPCGTGLVVWLGDDDDVPYSFGHWRFDDDRFDDDRFDDD